MTERIDWCAAWRADDHLQRASLGMIGAAAVAAGLAFYACLRPVRIPLIPPALHVSDRESPVLALLDAAPSAIHAFAMPLLTVACLSAPRIRHIAAACLGWCAIDLAFELGQASGHTLLPAGTFDPVDVLAIFLGTALAGALGLPMLRNTP